MKHILSLLLVLFLMVSLVACGSQGNLNDQETTSTKPQPNIGISYSEVPDLHVNDDDENNDGTTVYHSSSTYYWVQTLVFEDSEKFGKNIALDEKNAIEDNFDGYSENAVRVIHLIKDAIMRARAEQKATCTVTTNRLSCEDTRAIATYFWTYYGHDSDLKTLVKVTHTKTDSKIKVDLSVLEQFEEDRNYVYSVIDEALANMEDGSDRYILYQISEYICNLITYTDNHRNVIDAFDGKGVCGVYSLLFKMMAERVGIPVDIVTGYKDVNTPGHAWNRVCLEGTYLYYDVTALDTDLSKNYARIQSETDLYETYVQFVGVFYVHMIDVIGNC